MVNYNTIMLYLWTWFHLLQFTVILTNYCKTIWYLRTPHRLTKPPPFKTGYITSRDWWVYCLWTWLHQLEVIPLVWCRHIILLQFVMSRISSKSQHYYIYMFRDTLLFYCDVQMVEFVMYRKGSSSCSTCGTSRVNLVTNPVISHEWGKDREVFTSGTYPWSLLFYCDVQLVEFVMGVIRFGVYYD
jgi:hypothetical protein